MLSRVEAGLREIRESFANWLGVRPDVIAGFQQEPESARWRDHGKAKQAGAGMCRDKRRN